MADSRDQTTRTEPEAVIADLAMMLRRMIWQARQETGDTSMKVLAGTASELLYRHGLRGEILRHAE